MGMASKWIDVGDGLSVRFAQRARGQESPYWVGEIRKDGLLVGRFSNSGTGGATMIQSVSRSLDVVEAFRKLVDACPGGSSLYERESIVLTYAETLGYNKRARLQVVTLAHVVAEYAAAMATPDPEEFSLFANCRSK